MPDNHTPNGDAPPESDRLNAVVAEYYSAIERGETPNRDELLTRHPDLADGLREFFANHDNLASLAGPQFEATMSQTRSATPLERIRNFGDYEVLEKISRGGMGVVFKARQLTLKRIVAIKMILSGLLASPEDVERFHTEAEAAAKLDHPGIVPIYEIGQHEGQHYFSMGFVDGQSLSARVAQGPLPAREAAELVRTVAEAVQYAHDHGVIHRDLKPGNVLLDRQGNPRITDFGLAKLTESHSDLTGTGQVLGTPGYMPPEQAAAHVGAVGPLSDIYSLGAILYCLLTGRPPFQAATPIETLLQVQKKEPVAPRLLNPDIPLDLDTIVLKCLDKSPTRRYASAKALAQELYRYLEGRPILARRVSRAEQFYRWCRREPVIASLNAAVLVVLIAGISVSAYFAVEESKRAEGESAANRNAMISTVDAVQNNRGPAVPFGLRILEKLPRATVLNELKSRYQAPVEDRKLGLAYALADFGEVDTGFLCSQVKQSGPEEVENFVTAFGRNRGRSLDGILALAEKTESEEDWRLKARLAIVALRLEDDRIAADMCQIDDRPDPVQRTLFIDEVATWHGNVDPLAVTCLAVADAPLRSGLCLALGSMSSKSSDRSSDSGNEAWKSVVAEWYETAPDTTTHSAAGWTLRQWMIEAPSLSGTSQPIDGRQWFVNSLGMTLLKVQPGAFTRLDQTINQAQPNSIPQNVTLTRAFFLCDREISVGQFQQFVDDDDYPPDEKPVQWGGTDKSISPTPEHQVQLVNWYDAVLFCNWLSRKEGRTACYERTGKKERMLTNNPVQITEYDAWRLVPDATGYRLPTDAEWEYSCRAGTTTDFASGSDAEMLRKYATIQSSRAASGGSKLPNGWGLFDMHGNAWEWCQDWFGTYGGDDASDPAGPSEGSFRVFRGGGAGNDAAACRSGIRSRFLPDQRNQAFRPALCSDR